MMEVDTIIKPEEMAARNQKIEELENLIHNIKMDNESQRNAILSTKKFKPLMILFILLSVIFLALFIVWMLGKSDL